MNNIVYSNYSISLTPVPLAVSQSDSIIQHHQPAFLSPDSTFCELKTCELVNSLYLYLFC